MGDDVIGPVCQQERLIAVAVESRRSVGMLVFAISLTGAGLFPDFLSGCFVETNDERLASCRIPVAVNRLQVQAGAIQHRSRSHSKRNVEFPVPILDIELPNFVPLEVVAAE